ncbi:unnamed protein product [Echinostoma caproni]|uniref:Carbonyl reductase n=1 Tax=Echinostoma caproni TaxID=27848 RepID=A0A183AD60_9TREM|nr:unnamed protein product [Echinostoma caproni]
MKAAFVTGANKGIGKAIVAKLAQTLGSTGVWDVYLTARDVERGGQACSDLVNLGLAVKFHQLDITDAKSRHRFLDFLTSQYPKGIGVADDANVPFGEQVRVTMQTNFFDTLEFTEEFIPLLANDARHAEVGDHEQAGWPSTAYGVSKLCLIKASFILGDLLKQDPRNIVMNSCCPGYVSTDMTRHKGSKTPEQGADTPFYLATLPVGVTEPVNQFVSERRVRRWGRGRQTANDKQH